MKKISPTCTFVLILALMAVPVFAVEYCKDYLEPTNSGGWGGNSSKTFEEEISLKVSDTVFVDIWINDLREDDRLISGGFVASWTDNVEVSVTAYDTEHGGPWDPGMTKITPDGNSIEVGLGQLGCAGVDNDADIILAKLEIHKVGEGTGEITFTPPTIDTNVSCSDSHIYDPEINPNTFTIRESGSVTTTTAPTETTTSTSTTSTIMSCNTDEDCDDGLYCNGAESCIDEACEPGIDPCLPGYCNEETNSCESTPLTTTSTTTTSTSSGWESAYNKMWGSKKGEKLSLLRKFRDKVLANSEVGRNYLSMLYSNSSEVLTLLIWNPSLIEETKAFIDELLPGIQSALDGGDMILSKRQMAGIESLLARFETKASPELKTVIKNLGKDVKEGKVLN